MHEEINDEMCSYKILNIVFRRAKDVTGGGGFHFKQLSNRNIEKTSWPENRISSVRSGSSSSRKMAKYSIVMVRHGESEWNKLNLFCGWYDANLSDKGKSYY